MKLRICLFTSHPHKCSKGKGKVFPQIKLEKLKPLPIKLISYKEQEPFIELVQSLEKLKKQNFNADTTELKTEIDDLIYKLYDLSEDEIKVI